MDKLELATEIARISRIEQELWAMKANLMKKLPPTKDSVRLIREQCGMVQACSFARRHLQSELDFQALRIWVQQL